MNLEEISLMLKVDGKRGIPVKETALKIGHFHDKEEAVEKAFQDWQGGVYRSQDIANLIYGVCQQSEESPADQVYGILFGDDKVLKYLDVESEKVYQLVERSDNIFAILASEDVYFGGKDERVSSLFGGFTSQGRDVCVNSLQNHQGRLLDSGIYGLMSILEDKVLISKEELKKRNLKGILSLPVDQEGNLFGLVWYNDHFFGLIGINEDDGQYSLGEEILHYGTKNNEICQALIVPWGSLRNYPFSVLSCVNKKYLDLNGEKIEGTEVINEQDIFRVEQLDLSRNLLEVICSGWNLNQIIKVKIDLRKRELVDKETLVKGFSKYVYALEPVRDYELHQRLVEEFGPKEQEPKKRKRFWLF